MSIEKLEKLKEDYDKDWKRFMENNKHLSINIKQTEMQRLLKILIPILKTQSDQIADLRQQLAKKEDSINIDSVTKEARLRNG